MGPPGRASVGRGYTGRGRANAAAVAFMILCCVARTPAYPRPVCMHLCVPHVPAARRRHRCSHPQAHAYVCGPTARTIHANLAPPLPAATYRSSPRPLAPHSRPQVGLDVSAILKRRNLDLHYRWACVYVFMGGEVGPSGFCRFQPGTYCCAPPVSTRCPPACPRTAASSVWAAATARWAPHPPAPRRRRRACPSTACGAPTRDPPPTPGRRRRWGRGRGEGRVPTICRVSKASVALLCTLPSCARNPGKGTHRRLRLLCSSASTARPNGPTPHPPPRPHLPLRARSGAQLAWDWNEVPLPRPVPPPPPHQMRAFLHSFFAKTLSWLAVGGGACAGGGAWEGGGGFMPEPNQVGPDSQ